VCATADGATGRRREGGRTDDRGSAAVRAAHKIVSLEGLSALRDGFPDRRSCLCHGGLDLVHMVI